MIYYRYICADFDMDSVDLNQDDDSFQYKWILGGSNSRFLKTSKRKKK